MVEQQGVSGIAGVVVGQAVRLQLLVKSHDVKVAGTGKVFVASVLADVTGKTDAVHWDPGESDIAAYQHDVIEVSGKMGTYKNKPQLTIDAVRTPADTEIAWAQVLPVCPRSEESLVKWVDEALGFVDEPVKAMIQQVTSDRYFRYCPAASYIHHAYVRGLMEHTVDVARLVINQASRGGFDLKLAVAGALLHDIGKMYEYSPTGRRLPAAKELGHSLIGCQMVSSLASLHAVPQDMVGKLCHIIASHHGRREWGAVVEPITKEAWVVHAADLLDAKLASADAAGQE